MNVKTQSIQLTCMILEVNQNFMASLYLLQILPLVNPYDYCVVTKAAARVGKLRVTFDD